MHDGEKNPDDTGLRLPTGVERNQIQNKDLREIRDCP